METTHTPHKLPMGAPAVLVWLPKDQNPADGAFEVKGVPTTRDGPERWLVLREALNYAKTHPHPGRAPWIKVADRVLSPSEIRGV